MKDTKDELQREKDRLYDRPDENLQSTVNKLLATERQNEELRQMYQ